MIHFNYFMQLDFSLLGGLPSRFKNLNRNVLVLGRRLTNYELTLSLLTISFYKENYLSPFFFTNARSYYFDGEKNSLFLNESFTSVNSGSNRNLELDLEFKEDGPENDLFIMREFGFGINYRKLLRANWDQLDKIAIEFGLGISFYRSSTLFIDKNPFYDTSIEINKSIRKIRNPINYSNNDRFISFGLRAGNGAFIFKTYLEGTVSFNNKFPLLEEDESGDFMTPKLSYSDSFLRKTSISWTYTIPIFKKHKRKSEYLPFSNWSY